MLLNCTEKVELQVNELEAYLNRKHCHCHYEIDLKNLLENTLTVFKEELAKDYIKQIIHNQLEYAKLDIISAKESLLFKVREEIASFSYRMEEILKLVDAKLNSFSLINASQDPPRN